MDILTGERSTKLEYRYLRTTSVVDQEKVNHGTSEEELFPVEVSATPHSYMENERNHLSCRVMQRACCLTWSAASEMVLGYCCMVSIVV